MQLENDNFLAIFAFTLKEPYEIKKIEWKAFKNHD